MVIPPAIFFYYSTLFDSRFKTLQQNQGRYFRRLNRQHRVVYKVDEDVHVVEIYSARTHYESQ
uniref:Type II toxin-antitoxin system YoeB family toxin n=1 Tax=Enterococcus faecalis TaxID=1351 RepID=A0A890E7A3_ENTFL|nr:type II toxin-antitoxin system YoeB family toxin [Enterococcus faecalis]